MKEKNRRPVEPVYAVMRIVHLSIDGEFMMKLAIEKIVWTMERAESEVERLNATNPENGSNYYWGYTRLEER